MLPNNKALDSQNPPPSTLKSSIAVLANESSLAANPSTGRTVASNLVVSESEQQRRASHQPLSILQNRISS